MTPLILLHGAIGAASQFEPLMQQLNRQNIHALNFSGHGGEPVDAAKFSIKHFAEQTASFIHSLHNQQPIDIFGYSMGGYVALYMARHLDVKINRIITLGTKFHWDEIVAAKEAQMLQPNVIEQKIPAFAKLLEQRHQPQSWKEVLQNTANMLQEMGRNNPLQPDDYAAISTDCLIMLGDRDKMVSLEETISTYRKLPKAQLAVLPGTGHAIEQANMEMLGRMINRR